VLRGLVNTVPTVALVAVGVAILLTLVLAGVWLVRRFVPATREGFDAEVSSQMLGVVATLFGLLLAFVVVLAFQDYGDASDNVRLEADALSQLVRDAGVFAPEDEKRIDAAVGAYVRAVADDEWPRLRNGESSPRAAAGVDRLFDAMQATRPTTAAQIGFYDDSVRRLNDFLDARRNRVSDASGGLSTLIAGLLLLGTLVILGYAVFVGSRSGAFHAIGAGSIAVILGFSLIVLLVYNYPYSGDLAVDPSPFRQGVLAQFFTGP
jgi:hypothetical protein